ncbi:pyrroline-5-carboxylate reductase [Vibrio cincinnatiensis]|uniref:pyrroline-5-carboxylate reductase n=1 Tax=Vibrio cincinnatiensis TaxID=675 RepID=UPI001EDD3E56|nr:pyrroline-5-carboxylate reductase [Vibrio cincinnatiensis]MCG3759841.1 pyrroline-5-carboxylate reductase [Vibrio cincinnatiensis]MCG3763307.1 pyrroline-5-carboxylate reductase [Vibrio cincinnatiensis]
MEQRTIAFIGAGNMAHAIIAGLIASGYNAQRIITSAPSQEHLTSLQEKYAVQTTSDNLSAAKQADVVVLAVKPQLMAEVCQPLQAIDFSNKLVISIAAGVSVARLNQLLACQPALVRVMPNTPALVNRGMAGLFAAEGMQEQDKTFTSQLMSSVGKTCWVETEADINHVIAAAGSAPAYFFLFMEAMQAEAMAQGFDKETARLLVQQSALGAAEMVQANPEIELATLREQVTSKGGTTAEAIRTFNEHQLSDIVAKAMRAAVARAQEMEKLF